MSSSSWSHLLCWVWCVFLPAAFGYPRDFHPVFFCHFSRWRPRKCCAADFIRIHAKPRWTVLHLRVFWTKMLSKKTTFFGSVEKYWDVREYDLYTSLSHHILEILILIYKMNGYKANRHIFLFRSYGFGGDIWWPKNGWVSTNFNHALLGRFSLPAHVLADRSHWNGRYQRSTCNSERIWRIVWQRFFYY